MPSLASTTLVSRSTETTGSASAPPEVADVVKKGVDLVLSHPFVLVGLAIVGTLVVLSLIAYFTYRVIKRLQRKDGSPRSYLRPFMLRGDAVQSKPDDVEKGWKSARELINKISVPTLLFGTGSLALDDPIISNSKDIGEVDITEAQFEHDQDLPFSGGDIPNEAQRTMVCPASTTTAGDAVSRDVSEAIQTGIVIGPCTETEDSLKLSGSGDAPVFDSAVLPRRDVVVISDEKGIEGAGLTMNDIDALQNTEELCNDEIPVRAAALLTLSDKFQTFETFGEEAYVAHLETGAFVEPHSFGSLSSSYSTFDIHDLDDSFTLSTSPEDVVCSTPASSPRRGVLRSSLTAFKSKEDAQAALLSRRVDMQRSPELCFLIPNPVTRDHGPSDSATVPAYYCLEMMTMESVRKLMRYVARSRATQIHRPILTSPLASPFVVCGPGCPQSKRLKVALRGLLPSKTKAKVVRRGPAVKPSTIVSDKGSSSELLVDVLKRMLCRGTLSEPWAALTPFTASTAQSAAKSQVTTGSSLIQSAANRPSAAMATASSATKVLVSAVPKTTNVGSSLRPTKALTINKANPRSPPRTSASRSSPEKRSASSACTRMPTLVEEPEKDNLSLRSPPSTLIDEPRARRSSVALLPAMRSATTAISGASKSSRSVKGKDFKSPHSPSRARQVAAVDRQAPPRMTTTRTSIGNELPYGFPSPPVTVESCRSPRPSTVGVKSRQVSKPPTVKRASLLETASVTKNVSAGFSGVSCAKRHGLSDISNSQSDAHLRKTARHPCVSPSPLDRRLASATTLRASPARHSRKSSSSSKASENLRPAQCTPLRTRPHPSGTPSSTSGLIRGGVPATKGALRA